MSKKMTLAQVKTGIKLMKNRMKQESEELKDGNTWVDGYNKGFVSGIETALYYLDDPETVADWRKKIEKLKKQGE